MERAIIKTLVYTDIFDYPLKVYEIHKWLIGEKASLYQVEKALERLSQKSRVKSRKDYYFLIGRDNLVQKRLKRQKISSQFLLKTKLLTFILKIIPWIKLVGVSGGLAMENADKKGDIDLVIITAKKRLWLTRILTIFILDLLGIRRKVNMNPKKVGGKLCINLILEEDRLEQTSKNIYVAHEVLQMKVLWQREGIYKKYLLDNLWVFKFLPNWVGNGIMNHELRIKPKKHDSKFSIFNSILNVFERLAKWLQLKIMKKPQGRERIEEGAVYFHPNDYGPRVISEYRKKVKGLIN